MTDVFKTMIVEAAYAQDARDLAETIIGPTAQNMWTSALAPTSAGPATHYISSGFVPTELVDALEVAPFIAYLTLSNSSARTVMRNMGLVTYTPPPVPLSLTIPATFTGTVGIQEEFILTATGGNGSHVFSIWFGTLPDGLSLVGNTVVGTPTTPGTYEVGFAVTSFGQTDTELVEIIIEE